MKSKNITYEEFMADDKEARGSETAEVKAEVVEETTEKKKHIVLEVQNIKITAPSFIARWPKK